MNRKQKKYVELKQAASWLMHVLITGGCKEVKQESDKLNAQLSERIQPLSCVSSHKKSLKLLKKVTQRINRRDFPFCFGA